MHQSVHTWASTVITHELIADKDVWEAGSFDVNGSLKPAVLQFTPRTYTGTDIRPGPNVDRVLPAEELPPEEADVIICTEMLEHAQSWHSALAGLVRVLRPGGRLILTTRGPGFPKHDHPGDYWRFTVELMKEALSECCLDDVNVIEDDEAPGIFATAQKSLVYSTPSPSLWKLIAVPVE